MNWIKLSDKAPLIHHAYYWHVNGGIGGFNWYGINGFEFDLEKFEPSDEEIFWLDETAPDVELTVNELKDVLAIMHRSKMHRAVEVVEYVHEYIGDRIKELENNCPENPQQGDICKMK